MIYAVFLCSYFVSRPELDACNQIGLGPFRSAGECQAEVARTRAMSPGLEFASGFLHHMPARQELVCKHTSVGWE